MKQIFLFYFYFNGFNFNNVNIFIKKGNSAYIFWVFSSYARILITSQFPDVRCLTLICSLLACWEMENINFHLATLFFA